MTLRRLYGTCSIFLLIVGFFGCASMPDQIVMSKFSDTSRSYGVAILWSKFDAAAYHVKSDPDEKTAPDLKKLERVKVAEYEVKQMELSEDKREVIQIVEIEYYMRDRMVLKTITDVQHWEYDEDVENWFLLSGLPDFE